MGALTPSIAHRCKAAFGLPSQQGMGKIHVGRLGRQGQKKVGDPWTVTPNIFPMVALFFTLFTSPPQKAFPANFLLSSAAYACRWIELKGHSQGHALIYSLFDAVTLEPSGWNDGISGWFNWLVLPSFLPLYLPSVFLPSLPHLSLFLSFSFSK